MPYGTVDIQTINRYIQRNQPDAPLRGKGNVIVSEANRAGVSPYLLTTLFQKETQFGLTSGRFKNNPGGWGVHLGPSVNTSRNWREGIRKIAEGLAGPLYKGSGLTRAADIINKYAPPSENNTQQYINQTNERLRALGVDPNANVFGPASRRLDGAPPATTGPNETPTQSPTSGYGSAIAGSLLQRRAGESLFKSVMSGVLQSTVTRALQGDPQGTADAAGRHQKGDGHDHGQQSDVPLVGGGGGFKAGGGPDAHGSRALGNWQSDNAYDIMGSAGQAVYSPVAGKVIKISGQPGGNPQFAGYGITVRTSEGDLFFKHLGSHNVNVGDTFKPGQLLGTLDANTGGGPHIHLGGTNRAQLDRLNRWYLGAK